MKNPFRTITHSDARATLWMVIGFLAGATTRYAGIYLEPILVLYAVLGIVAAIVMKRRKA